MHQQILVKIQNIEFHENPSGGSFGIHVDGWKGGQLDDANRRSSQTRPISILVLIAISWPKGVCDCL